MLKTLQSGRAIAAISVAAFHLSFGMGLERNGGNAVFQQYTLHGNLGVDFFFVLSGFIILFAHAKDIGQPAMWGAYVYKRFARLFPIYWLYSAVFVLLVGMGIGKYAELPTDFLTWLSSFTLIRFSGGIPPLGVAWTLFHELAFYFAFSLLILNKRLGIAFFALAAVVAVVLFHYTDVDDRTAATVYSSAYNLTFLIGMGSYWLYKRGGRGVWELIAGIVILVFASLTMQLPHDLSKLVFAIGFGIILAGLTKLELRGYVKTPGVLKLIGDASYTIYLTHSPVIGLLLKIVIGSGLYAFAGPQVAFLVVLSGSIALGCVAYLYVERPLLSTLRNWRAANIQRAAA